MSLKEVILLASAAGVVGIVLGYYLRFIVALGKKRSIELELKQAKLTAEEQANKITLEAEHKASTLLSDARREAKEREEKIEAAEERLIKREDGLDKRQTDIDAEIENIKSRNAKLAGQEEKVEKLLVERAAALEKTARMSEAEAKEELAKAAERKYEEDLTVRFAKLEASGKEKYENRAKDILATAIQRLASSVASDIFSSAVSIPSDEVKGKIIGKEGRNIKAFERMTGVEVIVDDTPGAITISSFDPIRRAVAKVALEKLIIDGRIQPAKIEKLVEESKEEINKIIKEKGEQAAFETGVLNLDPRVISILGRLYFRTSYGQNVLQHSVEMTHIAGMIAEELGANVSIAKAGTLVHDIGKALDHEVQGTHVEIGRRILQKFGTDEAVIKAMQAHHEEYPFETIESIIVQVADVISGSRPGARRDSVENYIKRLSDLEAIATGFKGVEKAYALQAGREIRIFVKPEEISDIEAKDMARNIALKIEQDLKYPGEIKVHIIRESRIVEFAR